MPVTTTLISPPAWVNVTMRRSTAPIQSMFSVPLVIEMRAPDDTANHSTGRPRRSARSMAAMIRRHSASAREPRLRLGSPAMSTRRIPSGMVGTTFRITPTTRLAVFPPGARSTGTRRPSSSRSCSSKSPAGKSDAAASGGVSSRISSKG